MVKGSILHTPAMVIILVTLVMGTPFTTSVYAYDFPGWKHGAYGYERAYDEAEEQEEPLILYFNTDWCPWCQKLNKDYLASYEVEEFLSAIPKVEINPEKGTIEGNLAGRYGVTGYPSFLVCVPTFGDNADKITPFLKRGHLTPEEFVQAIKVRITRHYDDRARSFMRNNDYESAIYYYEKSVRFDPENADAYYGMGVCYHSMAYEARDAGLLEQAETNYERAIEIDPDHQGSKRELEKLRKMMEQFGMR